MTTYEFEKVTYNGVSGWFATRRIDGVYAGKLFGITKSKAKAEFDSAIHGFHRSAWKQS